MSTVKPFRGAAREWTEKELGGPIDEIENVVTVNGQNIVAVQNSADRVAIVFINIGSSDCFLALTPANANFSNGIRLGANGGNVTLSLRDDFTLPTRSWFTSNVVGNTFLYTIEYRRISYQSDEQP